MFSVGVKKSEWVQTVVIANYCWFTQLLKQSLMTSFLKDSSF